MRGMGNMEHAEIPFTHLVDILIFISQKYTYLIEGVKQLRIISYPQCALCNTVILNATYMIKDQSG